MDELFEEYTKDKEEGKENEKEKFKEEEEKINIIYCNKIQEITKSSKLSKPITPKTSG